MPGVLKTGIDQDVREWLLRIGNMTYWTGAFTVRLRERLGWANSEFHWDKKSTSMEK